MDALLNLNATHYVFKVFMHKWFTLQEIDSDEMRLCGGGSNAFSGFACVGLSDQSRCMGKLVGALIISRRLVFSVPLAY